MIPIKLDVPKRSGKAVIAVVVAVVVILAAILLFADFSPHGKFTLTVMFTGDLHGNMSVMPYYSAHISQQRRSGQVLLLDCGDLYQGGDLDHQGGIPEAVVLSAMKYDAMTLGNNEFWSSENTEEDCDRKIAALAEHSTFDILCANVEKNGELMPGIKPYTIVNKGGMRIAVIGLTTDSMDNKEVKNKAIYDPVEVLDSITAELEGKADIKIVLSHCETAHNMQFKNVDVIIAGHVHKPTETPIENSYGIPIVRAGGENEGHLGKLTLNLKELDGKWGIEDLTFDLLSSNGVLPDQKIYAIVAGLK